MKPPLKNKSLQNNLHYIRCILAIFFQELIRGASRNQRSLISILISKQIQFAEEWGLSTKILHLIMYLTNLCDNQTHDFDLIIIKIQMYSLSLFEQLW